MEGFVRDVAGVAETRLRLLDAARSHFLKAFARRAEFELESPATVLISPENSARE